MSARRFRGNPRIVVAVALLAAVGAGRAPGSAAAPSAKSREKKSIRRPCATPKSFPRRFNNAAEIAMPSVVTIRSKTKAHPVDQAAVASRDGRGENPFKGTPFEDLLRTVAIWRTSCPTDARAQGMGSGVIIDKSGIVLTNNHVVEGADEVIVHLADGREFKAEDIKTDEQTDLAVVAHQGRRHAAGRHAGRLRRAARSATG